MNQRDPISKTGAFSISATSQKSWNTRLDSNQRHRFRRPRPHPLDHGCVAKPGTGVRDRTSLRLFVGQRPSPEGDPRVAPGAGFEPARGGINSAVPSQLGYPGKTDYGKLVGNLGVEPSVLCVPSAADFRLPRSRTSIGRPIRTRTGISGFGNLCPLPLGDGP